MLQKSKMISLSEWAKRHGISRQRASALAADSDGRLSVIRMGDRAVFISENHPAPIKLKPYGFMKMRDVCPSSVGNLLDG
jgi:hypothetical protein